LKEETRTQIRRAAALGMDRDWIAKICSTTRKQVDKVLGTFPPQCPHEEMEELTHTRRCKACGFAEPRGEMVHKISPGEMPTKKRGMV